MRALIVGSGWSSKYDLDIICDYDFFSKISREYNFHLNSVDELGNHYVSKEILDIPVEVTFSMDENHSGNLLLNKYLEVKNTILFDIPVASDKDNLLLKLSHRFKRDTTHFLKTMNRIRSFRNEMGLKNWRKIQEEIMNDEIYKKRVSETYYYDHPKLNVKKIEFFDLKTVDYIYDHDSIHESIKLFDRPCYEYCKHKKNEVFLSKKLFNESPLEIQLGCVLEEAYVLAIERHQVPNNFRVSPRKSFEIALQKICTGITSGWFREFAWENYYRVLKKYDNNYVKTFQKDLSDGKIIKLIKDQK